jgi:aminodeoxyfutalosine synthase
MNVEASPLADLEAKMAQGEAFTNADARRILACPDLVSVGMLGESARKAMHGDGVTYGRVAIVNGGTIAGELGDGGELRIVGQPASLEEAQAWVRAAKPLATGVPLTGFSLGDLLALVMGDHLALADAATMLVANGLDGVAEVPLDRLGDIENAIEVVRAVQHGGLGTWRATIDRTSADGHLTLIERAAAIQGELSAFSAFAPLQRHDPHDTPSTGYDDVRAIAVARLVCRNIPSIQVDWPLYGPKLAQVAIVYGADDIDGIAAVDTAALGHRRSPSEDIERQIRSAFAVPAERNGRFEPRS